MEEMFAYERTRMWLAQVDLGQDGATVGVPSTASRGAETVETRQRGLTIRRILVPLDGSALAEGSLPVVASIARAFSAHITLLRVLEGARGIGPAPRIDALEWEISRVETQSYLAAVAERLQQECGLSPEIKTVPGKAAEQILNVAKTQQADLIALSTHGESGLNQWRISGTALKVIGSAQQSVLVVPAQRDDHSALNRKIEKILVPLDCSQRAECILPAVSELARVHNAEIILAHVVAEPELPRRLAPSTEDLELAMKITHRNRSEAQRYLRELGGRLSSQPQRVRVRLHTSAERIRTLQELADDEGVDLVALAAHGSSGDRQKRYGGVAESFIQSAKHPVIILQDFACTGGIENGTSGSSPAFHLS